MDSRRSPTVGRNAHLSDQPVEVVRHDDNRRRTRRSRPADPERGHQRHHQSVFISMLELVGARARAARVAVQPSHATIRASTSGERCATGTCSSGGTGMERFWSIDVSFQPTRASGFREVVGSIGASRGRLLLTNYESLTMAAQFPDVTLPQADERGQVLSVSPGLYDCRIVQLSDPESDAPFEETVSFVYEFTRATSSREVWSELPWRAA